MDVWVGLGGASRHACAAVCSTDAVLGVCKQERLTRALAAGFNPTGLPDEAIDELLRRCGRTRQDVTQYVLGEIIEPPDTTPGVVSIEHHFAHALSAFLTSPFDAAAIVVCDDEAPEVSVWEGRGTTVEKVEWPWHGPGFATLYSAFARILGFASENHDQRMEALARLEPNAGDRTLEPLVELAPDRLVLQPGWQSRVEAWAGTLARTLGSPESVAAAAALQSRVGDLLIEFLTEVKRRSPTAETLCVGGSLFNNSYFNSRVKSSRVFNDVFVPIDPGNAGLAVGNGLYASGSARRSVTSFLGPAYGDEDTIAVLNNCKLKFAWMSDTDAISASVEALMRGRMVGWFDGPMEWGARALGGRSIVASPFNPYVLENLNRFLKHRAPWRGYALSGLEEAIRRDFDGPDRSPFMECDYLPKDRDRFRHVLPGPNAAVRVHTVADEGPPRFSKLLRAFGEASGAPFLVNTSFNGFREPIVCSPRDAVRVFYGTGIDMVVLGSFVLTKE